MTTSVRVRTCLVMLAVLDLSLVLPAHAAAQAEGRGRGQEDRRNITCSSSGGYQRCSAPNGWRGARLVRQLSDAACTRGVTWGFERDYIWVTRGCRGVFDPGDAVADNGERVNCASPGRYVRCPAETRRGVTLIRRLSDAPCVEGRSWGAESGFIWVNRGCRAEFMVGRRGPGRPDREETVVCESSGGYHHCPVRFSERGARLVRQMSNAACTQGRSWGFDRDGIWVDRGCRGIFEAGDASADPGERVTCSSDGRMRSCPANTSRGVELVRQLSDAACRAEISWGYERGFIWVDNGCRAEFKLGGGYSPIRRPR
ncbi:MAG TPA: DUF3011 domain-containing protein [Gemmatimonadales bacterium]